MVWVRAVSLWLVQTTQTTKSLTALGPALGSPFPTLHPPPQMPPGLWRSTLADFCCIYFTFPSKSTPPFVSFNGRRKEILLIQVKPKLHINEKTPDTVNSLLKKNKHIRRLCFSILFYFVLFQVHSFLHSTSLCVVETSAPCVCVCVCSVVINITMYLTYIDPPLGCVPTPPR